MTGRCAVHSPALKRWHAQACRLVRHFKAITFTHIPREANRLADALANEALTDWIEDKGDAKRSETRE